MVMVRALFNSGVQMITYTESTKASILTGVACTSTLYTCCRDGKAKENHHPRKTTKTRKHPGSRKLDAYCISRMTVTKGKSGTVSVRYIQTHKSHTRDRRGQTHTSATSSETGGQGEVWTKCEAGFNHRRYALHIIIYLL